MIMLGWRDLGSNIELVYVWPDFWNMESDERRGERNGELRGIMNEKKNYE